MGEPASSGVTRRIDGDGVLWIVFDRQGERVNLLTPEVFQDIAQWIDEAAAGADCRGVIFTSAKPGMFVAGVDVERIAAIGDSHLGAEAARRGQAVLQKIADLERPSVCAIGGTCLGGGTELALACSLRLAGAARAVRIGLPEVQIGIIPGFGGSQRLPRRVGLTAALDLILTGRTIDARHALRIGLVDQVVPTEYLEREAHRLLLRAAEKGVSSVAASLRRRPALGRLAVERIAPLRRLVLGTARKRAASRAAPADYPAPQRAVDAIEVALTRPLAEGLDTEARLVGELIPSPTAKNLIWLFQSRTLLRKPPASVSAPPRSVRRLAVLGAGIMGGGIAQLAAQHEIPVRLKDLRHDALLTALRTARGVWQRQADRGRITPREVEQKMAFIAPTLDETGLRHVDLAIEAVVEDLQVKQQVLAEFERRTGERTVFASNTSSLPISDIAMRALRPERVVGLHFFNPVHRMPLVEVIAGRRSSPEAVATVHALAVRLGKVPVVVRDGPGFLVNRILTFYINEAMRLVQEGVSIEAVDGAMVAFGMPVGPFAMLDEVGLDTARHVGEVLRASLGKRAGGDGSPLDVLVGAGRLGKKSGQGFYRYRGERRVGPDPAVRGLVGAPAPRDLPAETLQERMILAMINEAATCLEEGVVTHPRDVDVGLVMGAGFPPFRGGLLRHCDSVGIPIVADRLSRLADAHGERFRPAGLLQSMVREQRRFHGR